MLDAYIYDGLRSPFGRSGGALASLRPDDLLAAVCIGVGQGAAVVVEAV